MSLNLLACQALNVIEIFIFGVNHIQLSHEYDCCFIYLSLYKISTFSSCSYKINNLFILMQIKVNFVIYILKLILQLLLTN